jgi:formate dehydrogenase major subunit
MKLVKKQTLVPGESATTAGGLLGRTVDRRTFLRGTGLAAGGAAVATTLSMRMMQRADAATGEAASGDVETKRSVCTHCSVGCGVVAEVQNGVWTGQEPDFDSPFNLGAHCAKGAAVREHGHGDKRLKYPMKLVGGKWQRVSWDEAIEEIGNKLLEIREQSARTRCTGSAPPSSRTSRRTCSASSPACGAPTTATTRRASATRPPWPVSRTPGATVR